MARRQYFIFSALTSKFYVWYFWTMQKIVKYFCCNNEENSSTKPAAGDLPCKICILASSFDKMTCKYTCYSLHFMRCFKYFYATHQVTITIFPFVSFFDNLTALATFIIILFLLYFNLTS